VEREFIFDPHGAGWHIDRARCDAMLLRSAEEAGAIVYREARLLCSRNEKSGDRKLEIRYGERQHHLRTRFLVDATGRASSAARQQGARRVRWGRLIGVVSFFSSTSREPVLDSSTLIEAVEEGWWYSAALPGSRLVLAYMTEADGYARAAKHEPNFWWRQLTRAKHTRRRVEGQALTSGDGPHIVPANSSRLDRVAGGHWLAIGDAAMAFDPLSGQGLFKALQSALSAAEAIDQYWTGNASALGEYAGAVEGAFERYCVSRRDVYARERRWPQSVFWRRQRAGHGAPACDG